ncbi:hypothetical protein AX17_001005 [Amanita inopinata Kibby_2008]|nr:hypothetical protein AX17_001005 [Amanita inopinata Kibby_2008]
MSFFSQPSANNSSSTAQPSGGGLFSGGSTAPASTNLFAAATQNANAPPAINTSNASTTSGQATSNSLFSASSSFSLPNPANQPTPKPATSSFFGQPTSTSGSSSTPSTGGLFGAPQKPAAAATSPAPVSTTSPAPSGGSLADGGLFGKPSTTAPSAGPAFAAPAKDFSTTSASVFGNFGGVPKPTETKSTAPATTGSFGFLGSTRTDEKKDGPAGPQSFTLGPLATKDGEKASDSSSLSVQAKTYALGTVAVPPPSMLRGKTIEEIVNRWSSELETHVKEFNKFAGEVAVWDRALIENSKNIAALHSHVSVAEREQNDINQSLDHIEQQQKDLASALDAYERIAQEVLGGQGAGLRTLDTGPADTERDKNYMLATDLHTQLDDLSGSLSQMIDSVNTLSLPGDSTSADDPISQIAQILSSHLESLQWIDGAVRDVEGKVSEVEKRVKESGVLMSTGLTSKSRGYGLNR